MLVVALVWALSPAGGIFATPGGSERVSVGVSGGDGNNDSHEPFMSADSRYVAFQSYASNLVDGDTNGYRDVFVRDRRTGTTERVSVSTRGEQGNGDSRVGAISADGRYVAFTSYATNLVNADTNSHRDAFVHDRTTGSTERVSVSAMGEEANDASRGVALSADGRFVAFHSFASNLVAGDTNGFADAFVRDRRTGTMERVTGDQANGDSWWPAISADGRYVAFQSVASNLVPEDTNSASDVFVHDRRTGTTARVSVDTAGRQASGDSLDPAVSADGRFVAFYSYASDLAPGDTNAKSDVFVHDRRTGATERASVDSSGDEGNGHSYEPVISADGRIVAFHTLASNLAPGDDNAAYDVFVHDRQAGSTERVSAARAGGDGNGYSQWPAISADGGRVAFHSWASNLMPGDANGESDVFVRAIEVREVSQPTPEASPTASGAGRETSEAGADASEAGEESPELQEEPQTASTASRWDRQTLADIGLGLMPPALIVLAAMFFIVFAGAGGGRVT